MSNRLKVASRIEFGWGESLYKANFYGPVQELKKHLRDDFLGIALDTTNHWATSVPGTSDTIAISEVAGGELLFTTGTVDDDSSMLAGPIIWAANKLAAFEARVTIDDVSGTGLFVGFSDAKSEANNSIAIHYPADALTTVATDGVGFVIDADHATSSIMCASVKANVDGVPVDTGVDWADGETKNLRVVLDVNGNAAFYLDGVAKGYLASAVTATTLFCFTVQVITRANDGANTVQLRRVNIWGDET